MASMVQNCLGACCLSLRKSPNKLSLVQPYNNARHLMSSLVVTNIQPSPMSTFPQLSLGSKGRLNVAAKSKEDRWKVWCGSDSWSSRSQTDLETPIKEFFSAINTKNQELLEDRLSLDCVFEDLILGISSGGKQNILEFLGKVMKAMDPPQLHGEEMKPSIRFRIDKVTKTDNETAKVVWHLGVNKGEVDKGEVPFTKDCCSVFEFEKEDGKEDRRPLIRKIKGIVDPDKTLDYILTFLKAVTTIFDLYDLEEELLSHPRLVGLLVTLGVFPEHSH